MAYPPKRSAANGRFPMALLALAAVIVIAGVAWSYHSRPSIEQQAREINLASNAESQLVVVGSLATLGSFEWDVAPLRTHIGIAAKIIATRFKRGELTYDQATQVQVELLNAKSLLDQASAACDQNDHTGKCRGSEVKARSLLDSARRVLDAVSY